MGLRQKSRGIRLGLFEAFALFLVLLTLGAGGLSWSMQRTGNWVSTQAYIVGLSVYTDTSEGAQGRETIEVSFRYVVNGVSHGGSKQLGRIEQALFGALPEIFIQALRERGYIGIEDFPPEIRAVLAHRGIASFTRIPQRFFALRESSKYQSAEDIPEELRQAARDKDYETLASALASELDRAETPAGGVSGGEAVSGAGQRKFQVEPVSQQRQAASDTLGLPAFTVLYNAARPSEYRVTLLPAMAQWTYLAVFFGLVALSLAYCGAAYPWLVRNYR